MVAVSRRPVPDPIRPGQESVWDYPRPPALVRQHQAGGDAGRATSWSPQHAGLAGARDLAPADLVRAPRGRRGRRATPRAAPRTTCEWKGAATYWDVVTPDGPVRAAAWSYEHPTAAVRGSRGCVTVYPDRFVCTVDGERVRPQEGGFYGGWITDDVVGPFKGVPGSWGW